MGTKLTEQTIQKSLNGFFAIGSIKYNVDNLYVFSWESDKLLWTKSGYIYEFEIKISRADYKNDFKHKIEKHVLFASVMPKEQPQMADLFDNYQKKRKKKYGRCITDEDIKREFDHLGDISRRKMPNYFYYAVPKGLIEVDEVPEYAGLIWIDEGILCIKKKAPCLHKEKYTDSQLNLGEKFYYNMKTWQRNYREQVGYSLMYRQRLQDELKRKGQKQAYLELEESHKEAERRVERAEKNEDYYKKLYYTMVEGADYNMIERHMFIDLVKELKPDFNYQEFMHKVNERYKERYPNRK